MSVNSEAAQWSKTGVKGGNIVFRLQIVTHIWDVTNFLSLCRYIQKNMKKLSCGLLRLLKKEFYLFRASNLKAHKKLSFLERRMIMHDNFT